MSGASNGSASGMRVTRLVLENWYDFTAVDAALAQRVLLVGSSPSGKSNLLDAVRFLRDLVDVGGGLQAGVQRRGGLASLRSLAAPSGADVAVEVAIGTDEGPDRWRYRVAFRKGPRQRPTVTQERVHRDGELILARPDAQDRDDPDRLGQTALEQVTVNRAFRPIADFLGSVRHLHVVPQLVQWSDQAVGRSDEPSADDILEQMAGAPAQTREARLERIRDALRVAVPELRDLDLTPDDGGRPHLRGRYEHRGSRGPSHTQGQFSDGTLQLVGVLWALLDRAGPLLLSEPVVSLYPQVVRLLPEAMQSIQAVIGRQVLISTHSTGLLGDPSIGLHEVLLLRRGPDGTLVRRADETEEVPALLRAGLTLAEAVTRPAT